MQDQRSNNLVPLRPAPIHPDFITADTPSGTQHPQHFTRPKSSRAHETLPPRRKLVPVACDNCRHRRTKCGGQRPQCNACVAKGAKCAYDAQAGETISSSLKRKLREIEDENTSYRDLYQLLKTRPETESEEILRRLRNTDDPREVCQYLKDAELLLGHPSEPAASASGPRDSVTPSSESDSKSGMSF